MTENALAAMPKRAVAAAAPPKPVPAAYPRPLQAWITVAILFLLYILALGDRYIVALLVEPIKHDIGVSDLQMSMLQGPAFGILYCLSAIPAGMALDRYSRRKVLYVVITIWSIAGALCGLARSFPALVAARAGVGAGEAGFGTGSYSIIGDSFPPGRVSLAMSIFVMGGVMGAGIVLMIGGPLIAALDAHGAIDLPLVGVLQPWQQAFIVTGLPGVLGAFLVFAFHEPIRRHRPVPATASYGEAFAYIRARPGLFTAILVGFGLIMGVIIAFQLWLPTYFARMHGWSPARIGLVLGFTQAAASISLPFHGWGADRLMRRGVKDAHFLWCGVTGLAGAPFGIAAFLVADPWITIMLYGIFLTLILPPSCLGPSVVQVVTPPSLRGRISAIYVLTTGLLAMGLGPAIVAMITDLILRDEQKIGLSLILTIVFVLLPTTAIVFMGRAGMRRTVAERDQQAMT